MKKFMLYGLAALLSFICFVAVFAPANMLLKSTKSQIVAAVPGLSINHINGTIWRGTTTFQYRDFPVSNLQWQLSALPLLTQQIKVSVDISGTDHILNGNITAEKNHLLLQNIHGTIDSEYINVVSVPLGLTLTNQLILKDLSIASDLKQINHIAGLIHWAGGSITARNGSDIQRFTLPALQGTLSTLDDVTGNKPVSHLSVAYENNPIVNIDLAQSGWVKVTVLGRLFELAAIATPADTRADDTVLEFEEKIL